MAVLAVAAGEGAAQETRFVRIGTGATGGNYFPVGGLIANAISSPPGSPACELGGSCGVPGLVAAAVATQGSIQNAMMVAEGKLALGLCQADVASGAYAGSGWFHGQTPLSNLRAIANVFSEQVHVVIRRQAPARSIADLKGQRISIGQPESGTRVLATAVLDGFGVRPSDLAPLFQAIEKASDSLIDGSIDGFFMVSTLPVPAIADLARRLPIRLLPIEGEATRKLLDAHPVYAVDVIPSSTYEGVPATQTVSVGAQLIVAAETDGQLVYEITRALWLPVNRKILVAGDLQSPRFRREGALNGVTIPLHPGAERYYTEAGMKTAGSL